MNRPALVVLFAVAVAAGAPRASAQDATPDTAALRERIEQRFDVLPLREGLLLRPRDQGRGVRAIEVTDGPIVVGGQPVTGAELRERLGAVDADLVLALSYLSDADRQAMVFESRAGRAPDVTPRSERRAPPRPERNRRRGRRDVLRFGGSITVEQDEVVDGDVVAIGGSVLVAGTVQGDVVAVGGNVTLGPTASVEDNVVVVGGSLVRDPGAHIGGRISEVRTGAFDTVSMRGRWNPLRAWGSTVGSGLALVGTLTRMAVLCLLSALVVLFGQRYMERAASLAATQPLKAGAIGLLTQLLFIPVLVVLVVMLVVTVVGIPLLLLIPFLILGLAAVGVVGFSAVALHVGRWFSRRVGWSVENSYRTTTTGVVLLLSPVLIGRLLGAAIPVLPLSFTLGFVGIVVEYLAWTIGFGSVALMRFGRPAPVDPPVPPVGEVMPA